MSDIATNSTRRLVIRISRNSLSFSTTDGAQVIYEPYALKSSISMAANLREALRTVPMLSERYGRVLVMVDSPVLQVPADEFKEDLAETYYNHSFTSQQQQKVLYTVLPELKCVAVFTLHKDLFTVITDAWDSVRIVPALTSVWNHLNQRSYTGAHSKLYGYFHEHQLEVFSFAQNRFKFCNSFTVTTPEDAIYYILASWKQLGLVPEHDELFLVGDVLERDHTKEELEKYIKRVFVMNPIGEFNRASVAQIPGIPYDLMALYVKGL